MSTMNVMYNQKQNVLEDVSDSMISFEVQAHNQRFEPYEGEITGREVKNCISLVYSNNISTENNIELVIDNIEIEDNNYNISSINNNGLYIVKLKYGINDMIKRIEIETIHYIEIN